MPPSFSEQQSLATSPDTRWCRNVRGQSYSFDGFMALIEDFHGHAAPGLLIGGRMVDVALEHLPQDTLFDAFSETTNCLPDAIQLLTPCTVGNGWLKVLTLGRFALSFYDKSNGKGIRVFLNPGKLRDWPEIRGWFFKEKSKADQDIQRLRGEIRSAGSGILGFHPVRIKQELLEKRHLGPSAVCPLCGEAYPLKHGALCRACQGEGPYRCEEAPGGEGPPPGRLQ